jgi:hypothetical protein
MNSVINYQLAILMLSQLLESNLITKDEFNKLEKKTAKKYGLKDKSIFRINNLIYPKDNGNMCDEEID